jgi:hypothetical protein
MLMLKVFVAVSLVFIFLFIAATKKGASSLGVRTKRMLSVPAKCPPESALKSVIRFAQQSGYKVVALDEAKGHLVLEESISLFTWGFFFPVFVSVQQDGSTLIEVGIKSKLFQYGPIVSRTHEKCVTGLKAALFEQTQ